DRRHRAGQPVFPPAVRRVLPHGCPRPGSAGRKARRVPVPGPVPGPDPLAGGHVPAVGRRRIRAVPGSAAHRRDGNAVDGDATSPGAERLMAELSRPIGLGLAARGKVSEVVGWADQARRAGLDSVWLHDSYFERDAVTYASAIASQVPDIRVAMGALNPL